jgi:hypothetical protein
MKTKIRDWRPKSRRVGLIKGMPEHLYHAGSELSSTGIKTMLDAPARYAYEKDNPRTSDAFDFGTAVHTLVLGAGSPFAIVDAADWRSAPAKERRDAARAAGQTPVLIEDYLRAQAAAESVRSHEVAGGLFMGGLPEVSGFTELADVPVRARFDYLSGCGNLVIDLKTTAQSVDPRRLSRVCSEFGYHVQASVYQRVLGALNGFLPEFLHVFVETKPPHLVTVVQLDQRALDAGSRAVDEGLARYRDAIGGKGFTGYPAVIHQISLPAWALHMGEPDVTNLVKEN